MVFLYCLSDVICVYKFQVKLFCLGRKKTCAATGCHDVLKLHHGVIIACKEEKVLQYL